MQIEWRALVFTFPFCPTVFFCLPRNHTGVMPADTKGMDRRVVKVRKGKKGKGRG